MAQTTLVHTVGHSILPIDAFLALLQDAGITHLVDVRAFPGSRRHPQFNRDTLASSLTAAGIAYHHMVTLGGRRKTQGAPNPENPWRNPAFAAYAEYTKTAPFRSALGELESIARTGPTAIMCAEALWWRCHRRIIAEELVKDGFAVNHIMGKAAAAKAERSPELPGL